MQLQLLYKRTGIPQKYKVQLLTWKKSSSVFLGEQYEQKVSFLVCLSNQFKHFSIIYLHCPTHQIYISFVCKQDIDYFNFQASCNEVPCFNCTIEAHFQEYNILNTVLPSLIVHAKLQILMIYGLMAFGARTSQIVHGFL